jgi:Ca-activated chloride channel family protein
VATWYRFFKHKVPVYNYSLTGRLIKEGLTIKTPRKLFLSLLRFCTLIGLVFLIARPQLVDERSKVMVEGIDIMMVLDVSGSMSWFDDPKTQKKRIDIAKEEAIKFIKKRDDDPIGIVMFGAESVARCPLTLDKNMLQSIIEDTDLGVIDADGTVLSKGLVTAIGRLRKTESKTKIIILLTDGSPSQNDIDHRYALELAKKYEIKIYTIGIGGKYGGLLKDGYGSIQQMGVSVNSKLLNTIAKQTGGLYFEAEDQKQLEKIYDKIDQLEKTEYETDHYKKYQDIFMPFLLFLMAIVAIELLLATFVWFGL